MMRGPSERLRRLPFGYDSSFVDHHHVVGQLVGLLQVLRSEHTPVVGLRNRRMG
jgi:hypothetical protein